MDIRRGGSPEREGAEGRTLPARTVADELVDRPVGALVFWSEMGSAGYQPMAAQAVGWSLRARRTL